MDTNRIRQAKNTDSEKIALLHANSWRTTYRGLLPDSFLDNDLDGERKRYWNKKMLGLTDEDFVLLAERGPDLAGFIAVLNKPENGFEAFIDNLHVSRDLKGGGIGTALMKAAAERLQRTGKKSAYLWVLKGNDAAEAFYFARGAERADVSSVDFGGKEVLQTRFVWKTLDSLLK
jgi:ribosomal protein S18 acetylase RimI-like enzyme